MSHKTASIDTDAHDVDDFNNDQRLPVSFVGKASTSKSPSIADELLRTDAGDVRATTVTMDRSGAEHITAERVTMDHSGAKSMETRSAQLNDSGVMTLKSEHAVLHNSSAFAVDAADVRMVKSRAFAIIADNLTTEGTVKTVIQFGPANGNVKPILNMFGAVSFGAAFGLVVIGARRVLNTLSQGR